MAVEDIPPRRKRGLGTRLEEILASTPEYRPSAARALYGEPPTTSSGGAVTPPPRGTPPTPPPPLPPPTDIQFVNPVPSSKRRPDKDPANYGLGPSESTRVRAYQFIPTSRVGDDGPVIGDLIVAFDRHNSGRPQPMYTYSDRTLDDYNAMITENSLGRFIGQNSAHPRGPSGLTGRSRYKRGTASETYYRSLHPGFTGEILSEEP
jgi:hypothetical protein